MIDRFLRALDAAVEDVRHKVVEEGWFGREVTHSSHPASADLDRSPLTAWGWGRAAEPPDIHHTGQAPDHNIDR